MTPPKRRAEAAGPSHVADHETRRQILEAAETLFIAYGFKGVSMKVVADAVAMTPAALYYHFPRGKEELFAETIRYLLQQTIERAFEGVEPDAGFRQQLRRLTRNILTTPVDRLAPLLHDAHEYLKAERPDFEQAIARGYTERMAAVFQHAIDAGDITAQIPVELLVTMHQGMCTALLTRRHFRSELTQEMPDEERLAATVVAAFLDGVGRAPPGE